MYDIGRTPQRILVFVSSDYEIQRRVVADIRRSIALTGGSDLDGDGVPDITVVPSRDRAHFYDELPQADVFFGWSIDEEKLRAAEHLMWVQLAGAGMEHIPLEAIANRGIILTNAHGLHSVAVAEHALALTLALTRRLELPLCRKRERVYSREGVALRQTELCGKRAGILGFGSIGVEIGRRLAGFGVEVWAMVKVPRLVREATRVFGPGDWEEFLGGVDIIYNCLPLLPATENWLDAEKLAAVNKGALLINVGRGGTVNEGELIAALEKGRLDGAALDVTRREPLPADSPLWEAPNLIITPHTASLTRQMYGKVTALFNDNLRRYLSGRELVNLVHIGRGY
ncbi:MAG: hypothetical protein GF399_04275 [Candidatus Coatesbacteria bacterium]|nr:hypothetical protein [Candidatus Coatesbacteria bacterium]